MPWIDKVRSRAPAFVVAMVLIDLVELVFHPPIELISTGIANGALYGLTAVGIILIYRNNRIVNFAAAGLGAVPGVLAALLVSNRGVPFVVAFVVAVVGGAAMGAASDLAVVRRFAAAPRLILTVATLGLVQILAFVAIYVPIWLGTGGGIQASTVATPFDRFKLTYQRRVVLAGNQVFALVVVVALVAGLALFFRRTRVGIALRAAAENADRATLLGVPVRIIGTIAWSVAGMFAGVTIFLRSTLVGIPFDGSLGYSVLLFALAAAVVGRMERVGAALLAGIGIGVIEQASVARTGSPDLTTAIMLLIILGALLAQRGRLSRAADSAQAGLASGLVRPIPLELRRLPEVRAARLAVGVVIAGVAIGAPYAVGSGDLGTLTLLPILAVAAVSLVILTGWAGQISLGQMGIVGVGAAVAGGLAANHNIDFFVALAIGTLAGAAVAVLVGLPAVRVQGLYLAVTTLSFAGAVEFWLLKSGYPVADFVLPHGANPRIGRPVLWHRLDLTNDRTVYFLCVAVLAGGLLAARSFRRSRSGRVFLAVRDNNRAAPSYAIPVTRTRLVAFALSGAVAAIAGVLFVYQQRVFDADTYGIAPSVELFVATVIGGLSSLPGAVLGTIVVFWVKYFGERYVAHASLLVTGPGVLVVLYLVPGGISQILYGGRDRALRWVAARRGIIVPSLLADRRVESTEEDVITSAGRPGDTAPDDSVDDSVEKSVDELVEARS